METKIAISYRTKHMHELCALADTNRERERERERETAEGGLANCQGKEGGWGAGGWSWRRKRYGGFCSKIPVPNVIFADLPYMQRVEIAKKIGTKPVDIMDDLAELDRMAAHF